MTGENKIYRAEVVKSMETIVRCINYEDLIGSWLMVGVADGDINSDTELQEIVEMGYCDDETFHDLMRIFMKLMWRAAQDGGLYCDGVCGGSREVEWK